MAVGDIGLAVEPLPVSSAVRGFELIGPVVADVLQVAPRDARHDVQIKLPDEIYRNTPGLPLHLICIVLILLEASEDVIDVVPGMFVGVVCQVKGECRSHTPRH